MKKLEPTKDEQKVMAKVLIEEGYSSRKAEEVLGIDHATVARYAQEPTPDDMRQFATVFKNRIQEQKEKGISLVHQRLLELIPRERRIDQLVKAGDFLEGRNNNNQVNVQVNNLGVRDASGEEVDL